MITGVFTFNVYRSRKPLKIMPIKYTGTEDSGTDSISLSIESVNDCDSILISLYDGVETTVFTYLDEDTAVQFAKDLRRSIAKVKEVKRG